MSERRRVAIVGSGIFGVCAALELRRRDHEVVLLDPGPVPHPDASSTDITKAIRADYGSDELYMDMMAAAFPRWDEWNRAWGPPLYHEDGFLFLSRDEMRPGEFEHECFTRLARRGYALARIRPEDLRDRFPAWPAERYADGYFNPRAGWAESGNVVARLASRAQRNGVTRLRETFRSLLETDARVAGVECRSGHKVQADFVVVAAGAWTPVLLPQLADRLWPVAQPVFHFQVRDPSRYRPPLFPVWGADISHTGWYGFPAFSDGTLKIANHGPGRRVDPDAPRVTAPEDEEKFRSFLRETFPQLANAPVLASRLCLYCDAWDGNFYVDHDPERPGLFVASGGSGHGFKFAPVIGEIVADVLEGNPNRWAERFAWRPLGEVTTEDARHA